MSTSMDTLPARRGPGRASWPQLGIIAAIVAIYANLPVVAARFHGVPPAVSFSILAILIAAPLFYTMLVRNQPLILDRTFAWMVALLGTMLAASLFARDVALALEHITVFVAEGLLLYVVLLNLVRDWTTLRRAVLVLVITGGLLGGMGFYQEVTGAYWHEFGGLASRELETETGRRMVSDRAIGPVGEINRFAQTLLVLLPLALFRLKDERSRLLRLMAAGAGFLILGGVLATYSRGAFVAVAAMALAMPLLGIVRMRTMLAAAAVVALMTVVALPGYVDRILTITDAAAYLADDPSVEPDPVTESRLTESLAAFRVALDFPYVGVGPGHYTPYYSEVYQLDPETAFRFRPGDRRAHNLYAEMAAETGTAGVVVFVMLLVSLMYGLYRTSRRLAAERPEMANMALGFLLALIGYMVAGLFLHLAYQRYLWMLVALAAATLLICRREERSCSES